MGIKPQVIPEKNNTKAYRDKMDLDPAALFAAPEPTVSYHDRLLLSRTNVAVVKRPLCPTGFTPALTNDDGPL